MYRIQKHNFSSMQERHMLSSTKPKDMEFVSMSLMSALANSVFYV